MPTTCLSNLEDAKIGESPMGKGKEVSDEEEDRRGSAGKPFCPDQRGRSGLCRAAEVQSRAKGQRLFGTRAELQSQLQA